MIVSPIAARFSLVSYPLLRLDGVALRQITLVVCSLAGPTLLASTITGSRIRRPMLEAELLRPASRRRWVHAVVLGVAADVGLKGGVALIAMVAGGCLLIGLSSAEVLTYAVVAAAAYAILAAAMVLLGTMYRGLGVSILLAITFALTTLLLGWTFYFAFNAIVVDYSSSNFGFSSGDLEQIRSLLANPITMLAWWSLALGMFGFAYLRWMTAELAVPDGED